MKKIIFAIMAMALVALTMGCSKEDLQQKELTLTVSEITDNTAILNCTFTPKTSATYQLRIGEAVSKDFSGNQQFTLSNLAPGQKYSVIATTFDASHKQVGTAEVEFRTTGTPDNEMQKQIFNLDPTISFDITDISDESVAVSCDIEFNPFNAYESYSLSCDKGGVFSETGRFTADKTLTLSNLKSGTEYTITATFYTADELTLDIQSKFTKE